MPFEQEVNEAIGKCPICKRSWGKAPTYPAIPCGDMNSMFPVCADCYQGMSFEEVRKEIQNLVREWGRQDPLYLVEHLAQMNQAIGWVRCDKQPPPKPNGKNSGG